MPDTEDILSEEEKCMDEPMARPYGGATSFDELDAQRSVMEYASKVDSETYTLQTLIGNITSAEDMTPEDKASAISKAASDYKSRVSAIQQQSKEAQKQLEGSTSFWDSFVALVTGTKRNYSAEQRREMAKRGEARPDGSFPIKDATDLKNAIRDIGRGGNNPDDKAHIKKRARALGKTDMIPENWKEFSEDIPLPANRGFKVYRDQEGDLRWLSLSSNAFEDLDKELFTTKALEEAIEQADKTGERGPLLIYHVPSAEIGQCDFQGMAGRFLIESGTFDDTPLGRKAVEYFVNSDEEHQVSIGFQYQSGDEEDGVYDWLNIIERSVTPYGAAANPWTDFKIIGENPMDARKAETLEKIFGKELSAQVIASAEERTKELEASVAFKNKDKEEAEEEKAMSADEMKTAMAKMPDGPAKDAMKKKLDAMGSKEGESEEQKEEEAKETSEVTVPTFGSEQLTQLATLITDLSTQVESLSGLKEIVEGLQTEVKELKKSDDAKMADMMAPRWSAPGGIRPTESTKNVIEDAEKILEMSKEAGEQPVNPAQAYVDDILGNSRVRIG